MTSAFIIQVQPQLQSDPNEETAALLRVLIHKIDNTTLGNDVPTIPQWSGPPHTIVQVQAILSASLAASLFSAFLAMLGKQWLNRYSSIDMRGSAIERSQNRQRKLDGVVTWYFDYVMESLPLMLQFALLLIGCALSRYLWEIDTTVASVVLGVTSFGVASYSFFVVAGAASASCPYQTPGTHILRHIIPLALSSLRSTSSHTLSSLRSASSHTLSALRSASSHSVVIKVFTAFCSVVKDFKCSTGGVAALILLPLSGLSIAPVIDVFHLARVAARAFFASVPRVCGWPRRWCDWFFRGCGWFRRVCEWGRQTTTLDLRCVIWMLQTSLDKAVHLSTLRLLATMATLVNFDPTLASTCLDILVGCMSTIGRKAVIIQGSEELATVSSLCYLRTLSNLTTMDPAPSASKEMYRRYTKAFPINTDFEGLPSRHRFCIIHNTIYPSRKHRQQQEFNPSVRRPRVWWRGCNLSSTEHTVLIRLAQFEYQRKRPQKVPRWILRYGFHILSKDPLPPTPVITDCLSIIAMDLGCAVSTITTLDEKYIHI